MLSNPAAGGPAHAHSLPQDAAPALTVGAVIEHDGRFLMIEEIVRGTRVINQPSGHVEPRESLVDAAVRETLEETAWLFAPVAVTGIYYWRRPGRARGLLRVVFCGTALHRESGRTLDRGIVGTHWLSRADLVRRSASLRNPIVLRCIDDYRRGVREPMAQLPALTLPGLMGLSQAV